MNKVAILCDSPLIRKGIVAVFAHTPDIVVVDVPEELLFGADVRPARTVDLAIVVQLGAGETGSPMVTRLAAQFPVLVIAPTHTSGDAAAALHAGASGYLAFNVDEQALVDAVRETVRGGMYFAEPSGTDAAPAPEPELGTGALSPREQQALTYIARGFTHQQTARRMGVSKTTVNTYVSRIRQKLNVGNKAELTLAALRHLGPDAGDPAARPSGADHGSDTSLGRLAAAPPASDRAADPGIRRGDLFRSLPAMAPRQGQVADGFAAVPWDAIDDNWGTFLRRHPSLVDTNDRGTSA